MEPTTEQLVLSSSFFLPQVVKADVVPVLARMSALAIIFTPERAHLVFVCLTSVCLRLPEWTENLVNKEKVG